MEWGWDLLPGAMLDALPCAVPGLVLALVLWLDERQRKGRRRW